MDVLTDRLLIQDFHALLNAKIESRSSAKRWERSETWACVYSMIYLIITQIVLKLSCATSRSKSLPNQDDEWLR